MKKVENFCEYPVHLGDGRMIGAAGTPEAVREYGEKDLTDSDNERVKRKLLRVLPEASPVTSDPAAGKTNNSKGDK